MNPESYGPLTGIRVVEMAGIGPAPFAGMLLADLGADVVRVERPGKVLSFGRHDLTNRGKRSITADLKQDSGKQAVRELIRDADVLIEGFRPGVMERLSLGPDECSGLNPGLVYGRITGWGQDGPLSARAGHDINYLSVTGALWAIGRRNEPPVPPLNLVADYGGGAMFLAFGIVAALYERVHSGEGQVVDAAMVDGVAALTAPLHSMRHAGLWKDERGANVLDSGAPFYEVYECADGEFVAVGAIEPGFYEQLVRLTGFRAGQPDDERFARTDWDMEKAEWKALFKSRTRDEWTALTESSDACLTPVLNWTEAQRHPQLAERETFVDHAGVVQPTPVPRFSRTPGRIRSRPRAEEGRPSD